MEILIPHYDKVFRLNGESRRNVVYMPYMTLYFPRRTVSKFLQNTCLVNPLSAFPLYFEILHAIFEVVMAVTMKNTTFWDASPCSLIDHYQTTWCRIQEDSNLHCVSYVNTLYFIDIDII
jgi:hypothetical protein